MLIAQLLQNNITTNHNINFFEEAHSYDEQGKLSTITIMFEIHSNNEIDNNYDYSNAETIQIFYDNNHLSKKLKINKTLIFENDYYEIRRFFRLKCKYLCNIEEE